MNGNGKREDGIGQEFEVTEGQVKVVEAALKRLGWEPAEQLERVFRPAWGDTTFGRLTGLAVFVAVFGWALSLLIDALKA